MKIKPKLHPDLIPEKTPAELSYLDKLSERPTRYNMSQTDLYNLKLLLTLGISENDYQLIDRTKSTYRRFSNKNGSLLEIGKRIREDESSTRYKYSLNTIHYRQRNPIGCSVSCYLMAQSVLRKGHPPSRNNEAKLIDELSNNGNPILLSSLMAKGVEDGHKVAIYSERDYDTEKLKGSAEEMRERYVKALGELSENKNFENTTGVEFDEDFFLTHLRKGFPVLVNGVTKGNIPHMYLFCGYRIRGNQTEFLISDPLDRKKRWYQLSEINNKISPQFGKWAMVISESEKEKIEEKTLEKIFAPIDQFNTGRFGERIKTLLSNTNIPYLYLPDKIRADIPNIVTNVLVPKLQQRLRDSEETTLLRGQIEEAKKEFDPEEISIEEFFEKLKQIYLERINVQKSIALVLSSNNLEESEKTEKLEKLLADSRKIEPIFFVASSRIKDFIAHWEKTVLKPRVPDESERRLFLTPSIDAFPFFYDQIDQFSEVERSRLFDNLEPSIDKIREEADSSENESPDFQPNSDKIYLILNRKVPSSETVDQLLIIDHLVEKFFERRMNFLHDLFAMIYFRRGQEGKTSFPENKDEIEEDINLVLKNF